MEVDSKSTYIEEDIWGLGESSLILIENEIEKALNKYKDNTPENNSDNAEKRITLDQIRNVKLFDILKYNNKRAAN